MTAAVLRDAPAGRRARAKAADVRELFRQAVKVGELTQRLDELDERYADVHAQWADALIPTQEQRDAAREYFRRRKLLVSQLHRVYSAAADFLAGLP